MAWPSQMMFFKLNDIVLELIGPKVPLASPSRIFVPSPPPPPPPPPAIRWCTLCPSSGNHRRGESGRARSATINGHVWPTAGARPGACAGAGRPLRHRLQRAPRPRAQNRWDALQHAFTAVSLSIALNVCKKSGTDRCVSSLGRTASRRRARPCRRAAMSARSVVQSSVHPSSPCRSNGTYAPPSAL